MTEETQKVLIVDDSLTNLALLDHMLGEEGCTVVQAKSGIEALDLVRNNDFALILLDIQMPGMNGYEAALKIKELDRGRHVPIIFITAIYQDDDNVKQGYETGAVDYLFRPVDVQTLKSKVQVFLQMNHQKLLLQNEIEQRKKAEKVLRQTQDKYKSIFDRAVEGIYQSTIDGVFTEVNPAMVRLCGYDSAEEMIGVEGLFSTFMVDPDERRSYLEQIIRDGFITNFEYKAQQRNGEIIWCSESSRLVKLDGDEQLLVEGVVEDISQRKIEEIELKHLATVDSLTGVSNRHLFFDRLEHSLAAAKRQGAKVAVLFIDLNEFKQVNDTYGHNMGDRLLRMVADRLQIRIRAADTLSRIGGDEFGVILEGVESRENVARVGQALLKALGEPFELEGELITVGATIGASFYPEDGKDCVSLVSRADSAMYRAKKRGKVRYGEFEEYDISS